MSRAIANCLVSSGASDYTKVGRWGGNTLVLHGAKVSSSSSQLPRYKGATDDVSCPRVDMPLSLGQIHLGSVAPFGSSCLGQALMVRAHLRL